MKKYYVYVVEHIENGRQYVGAHGSEDFWNDGYMGSGRDIKLAIKEEGPSKFEKFMLGKFDTPEEAVVLEEKIVTREWCSDPTTYNILLGGGGSIHKHTNEAKSKLSLARKGKKRDQSTTDKMMTTRNERGWDHTEKTKKKMSDSHKGKRFSEEHKRKISESIKAYHRKKRWKKKRESDSYN